MFEYTQLPLPLPDSTIEIRLTKGYTTIVDAIDSDLSHKSWYTHFSGDASSRHPYAARRGENSKDGHSVSTMMHRLILSRMLDRELTKGELVDHINGDGLDNRRSNLRLATASQNTHNSKLSSKNKSGYKGVFYVKRRKKWSAQIMVDRKQINLGSFDTAEEACVVYCEASKKYRGEFSRLK